MALNNNFYGRERELRQLKEMWTTPDAELVFVRGRRRVGKSRLLRQLAMNNSAPGGEVFFFSGRVDETDVACRERFARDFDEFIGTPTLMTLRKNLLTWDKILVAVAEQAKVIAAKNGPKMLLVLDEIQWLARRHSGVLGAIKEFWEKTHPVTSVKMILSGSSNRFFAAQVDHAEGVLRGLRTKGDLVVPPFSLEEVAAYYFPNWTKEQVALIYMLVGGVPYYLEQIKDIGNFLRSLNTAMFTSQSIFIDEIDAVLKIETTGKGALENVKRVLGALGQDGSTEARIVANTGLSQSNVHDIIARAESFGIVKERLPFGIKRAKKQDVRYYMDDFYLNSYFQILLPMASRIQGNTKNGMLINHVITSFEGFYVGDFSGKAFELLLLRLLESGACDASKRGAPIFQLMNLGEETYEVGTYWVQNQTQIDIMVSCGADRQVRVLEAKWKGSAMSSVETAELVKAVMKKPFPLPNSTWTRRNFLILSQGSSSTGLDCARDAGVEVISLEQLFGHATCVGR